MSSHYVLKVNEKLGVSPGCFTKHHALQQTRKRKAQKANEESRDYKKKRLEQKQTRLTANVTSAICEGAY